VATAEDIEQIIVIEFVKQIALVPVIHIANQRQTSPQHGAMLRRMGVLAGASDLFFPRGNQYYSGLFIEIKTKTGKPTPLQSKFLDDMRKERYMATVAYGSQDAINCIVDFYNLPEKYKKPC
jgi:hypothetical protein